jgi:hypothetical protein
MMTHFPVPQAEVRPPISVSAALRDELVARLQSSGRSCVIPPQDYVAAAHANLPRHYAALSPKFLACVDLLRKAAPELSRDYNRFLFASLLAEFKFEAVPCVLPESTRRLYVRELSRILAQLQTDDTRYADVLHDAQRKDFAVLTGRLIPVGGGFAAPDCGIPRSVLLRGGLPQFVEGLRTVFEAGGFRPWLELHTHPDSLSDFSPEGWLRSYQYLAELLAANPRWRGVFRGSWFIDPALRDISPNLCYLREVPVAGGARVMFVCHDRKGDSGALHKSGTRRKLFAEGRYLPAIHLLAWPRARLLAWARSRPVADP